MRHDSVKRAMERLSDRGLINFTQSVGKSEGRGRPSDIYHVNERDSYVVMAQLSPEFTARLVDEWRKLKEKIEMDLNDPRFLRQTLLDYTQKLIETEAERDHAIKTKAWISDKKTASAMGTASGAVRGRMEEAENH